MPYVAGCMGVFHFALVNSVCVCVILLEVDGKEEEEMKRQHKCVFDLVLF